MDTDLLVYCIQVTTTQIADRVKMIRKNLHSMVFIALSVVEDRMHGLHAIKEVVSHEN